MLQLFFTIAFSAAPLTLYLPPVRSLNVFVETMEDLLRESRVYTQRLYPRARVVWSRILDCMLCNLSLSLRDRIPVEFQSFIPVVSLEIGLGYEFSVLSMFKL
ncbi:hypothetical protein DITRI_Ditri13aG0003400 [Diplodiscus trichospermus]